MANNFHASPRAWQSWCLPIGLAAAFCSADATQAQEVPTDIGVLSCVVSGGTEAPSLGPDEPPGKSHDIVCTFTPHESGPEETYVGLMQLVGEIGVVEGRAMMWGVKGLQPTEVSVGLLEQTYSPLGQPTPGQVAPLSGDANASLVLRSLGEKESSARATEQPGVVITSMALKLRSSQA